MTLIIKQIANSETSTLITLNTKVTIHGMFQILTKETLLLKLDNLDGVSLKLKLLTNGVNKFYQLESDL